MEGCPEKTLSRTILSATATSKTFRFWWACPIFKISGTYSFKKITQYIAYFSILQNNTTQCGPQGEVKFLSILDTCDSENE